MATKLELMAEQERFDRIGEVARVATTRFDFHSAVKLALDSLPHLLGKLQYEKRYCSNSSPPIIALDAIFHFAPPNFLYYALDAIEKHLDEDKRIEKASDHDLRGRVNHAKSLMEVALSLWQRIEQVIPVSSVVDEDQKGILADWQRGGIVTTTIRGNTPHYSFALELNSVWTGKCECCGVMVRGAKVQFLNVKRCPSCRGLGRFVLVSPVSQ